MRNQIAFFVLLLVFASACTPKFNTVADAEEIRVVIGVLNPEDSVQYVRVSRGFLIEGDAIAYAGEADLSWTTQNATLTSLSGQTIQGYPVTDIQRDPGIFNPSQVVFKFITDGNGPTRGRLEAGTRYKLNLGLPDGPEYITGETTIPFAPELRGTMLIQDGAGTLNCLPKLDLRYAQNISWLKVNAGAYEVRAKLRYKRTGVSDSLIWGPSPLVEKNGGCLEGADKICYKFPARELLNYFLARMPQGNALYTYDTHDSCVVNPHNDPAIDATMPRSFEIEITAVDTQLTRYMQVNNQGSLDLTTARPEYTNLSGTVRCVGILGSINLDRKYGTFNMCTERLLDLNNRPFIPDCQ